MKCPKCSNERDFSEVFVCTTTRDIRVTGNEIEYGDYSDEYDMDDIPLTIYCSECGFEGLPGIFNPKDTGPYIGCDNAGYYFVNFMSLGILKTTKLVFSSDEIGKYHKKIFNERTKTAKLLAEEFLK